MAGTRQGLWARILYRGLDALLTAPLEDGGSIGGHLSGVLRPGRSHYERLRSLSCALDACAPGAGRRLAGLVRCDERLPFAGPPPEVLAFGSGATVFRLRPGGGEERVLKVYRRTLGRSPAVLGRLARDYRANYELFRTWYGEACVPTHHLLVHSPVRGAAAVARVQPFLAGERLDALALRTRDRVLELARRDAGLRAAFEAVTERTLGLLASGPHVPDFLGGGNLLLVAGPGGARLRIADFGVFDRDELEASEVEACARRIEGLREEVAGR